MSEPMTLGEVLEQPVANALVVDGLLWGGPLAVAFAKGVDAMRTKLIRSVYGTDEPCPECETSGVGSPPADGRPYGPVCPTCHELRGTGRIKTPGLVERWMLFLCYAAGVAGEDARAPDEFRPVLVGDVLEFLRREIGEV